MVPYCNLSVDPCWELSSDDRSALVSGVHIVVRVHNLHSSWSLCSLAHWAMTRAAGERRWLSTKWVFLSLKSSCAEVTLWWALTRDANDFTIFIYSDIIPNLPCHEFSNHIYSKSLAIQPNHWSGSSKKDRFIIGTNSFLKQNKPDALSEVLPIGKIYLLYCPSGIS